MRARSSSVLAAEWRSFEAGSSVCGPQSTRRGDRIGSFESSGVRRCSVLKQCPSRTVFSGTVDFGVALRLEKTGGRQFAESNKSLDRKMTRYPVCVMNTADREDALGPLRSARRYVSLLVALP